MESTKTGYPSIDKPWLKYYCDTVFRNDLASTIFHRIYEHNKSYLDDVAILFYGRKICIRGQCGYYECVACGARGDDAVFR